MQTWRETYKRKLYNEKVVGSVGFMRKDRTGNMEMKNALNDSILLPTLMQLWE